MASTLSTINEAMVDNAIAEALRHNLPALNAFSKVIETGEKVISDSVYVPLETDPTAQNKTAGTTPTADGGVTGTAVTLDTFKASAWDAVEGKISGALFPNYWTAKIKGATKAVVKSALDAGLALITSTNYGDGAGDKLVVAAADFDQTDLANLWGKATTKIKGQQKTGFLNTAYATAVFGTSQLAAVYASAGNNFLQSGQLPRFLDMEQIHYADIPTNSQNLGGFVCGRAAIAVALARPSLLIQSGEGNVVERRIITDAETGVSVLYTVKAEGGGTVTGEIALLFGVAKGQDAIVRLVTA